MTYIVLNGHERKIIKYINTKLNEENYFFAFISKSIPRFTTKLYSVYSLDFDNCELRIQPSMKIPTTVSF